MGKEKGKELEELLQDKPGPLPDQRVTGKLGQPGLSLVLQSRPPLPLSQMTEAVQSDSHKHNALDQDAPSPTF